jgi:hypothetical protein
MMTRPPPSAVPGELIHRIEAFALDQALGQAERHGGVIGPLTGLQAECPATHDVGDRAKRPGALELQRRPEGVTRGKTEEGITVPVNEMHEGPLSFLANRRISVHPPKTTRGLPAFAGRGSRMQRWQRRGPRWPDSGGRSGRPARRRTGQNRTGVRAPPGE